MFEDAVQGFRLSTQQRHLWMLDQAASVYRAQMAVRITGHIDCELLHRVVNALADRHEIFRTTFHRLPGMNDPLQVVADHLPPGWQVVDFCGDPPETIKAKLEAFVLQDRRRPFDVANGPMLRFSLLLTCDQEATLVVCAHPLCADAGTLRNILCEIAAGYEDGFGAVAPETVVQYVQFSEWQNEQALPRADVPVAPRSGAAGFRPELVSRVLSPSLGHGLTRFAVSRGVSEDAVLAGCWAAVLRNVTGQAKVTVGWSKDCRAHDELREAMGPFAVTLPVRFVFPGPATTSDLARQFRVAEPEIPASLGRSTATASSECRFHFASHDLRDEHTSGDVVFSGAAVFVCDDHSVQKLHCSRSREGLTLELHYDATIDSATGARQRLAEVHALLESVAADSERLEPNIEARGFPPGACVHHLIEAAADAIPDAVAVVDGDHHLTRDQLDRRANQLARLLRRRGIGEEAVVGVYLKRSSELVVTLLAVLKAGAAFLPLDQSLPAERLAFMLDEADVSLVITQDELYWALPVSKQAVGFRIDRDRDILDRESALPVSGAACADALAYVIYTSGSTGRPKGVMVQHQGLSNYLAWSRQAYAIGTPWTTPVHTSIAFDLTITSLFLPLVAGGAMILLPELPGVDALRRTMKERELGLVKLTPAHLLVLSDPSDSSQFFQPEMLIVGGEALQEEALRSWRALSPSKRIVNEYGPTETVVGCSIYVVEPDGSPALTVPIGEAVANTHLGVLDRDLREARVGEAGELYIGGPQVARGYIKQPALTAERFLPATLGAEPGARMYRSGDLVRRLADGNLAFVGRVDRQVKINGFRVELDEIEAALNEHPAVRQVAVVLSRAEATPVTISGQPGLRKFLKGAMPGGGAATDRLVAYVVCKGKLAPATAEWRQYLRPQLPDYMIPAAFVQLPALPLTSNGKVDTRALQGLGSGRPEMVMPFAAPSSPEEKAIAETWSDVLGIKEVGIDDGFFELGGDSMRALQIVARLRERGVQITLEELFRRQTIRDLARCAKAVASEVLPIAAEPRVAYALLLPSDLQKLPADVEDAYPLARIQAGVIFHNQQHPESPLYHDIFVYRLSLRFDARLFRLALDEVIGRHDILRTTFDLTEYSEPIQLVHKRVDVPIAIRDLGAQTPEEQQTSLTTWIEAEKQQAFEWSTAPLIRYSIDLLGKDSIRLILSFSDSVIDGWSIASLVTELLQRYSALLDGNSLPVARPCIRYRDFVALERLSLRSLDSRQFWQKKLQDCSIITLPRWSPATNNRDRGAQGAIIDVPIDGQVWDGIREVARLARASVKHVLLAAHLKVMSLLSGQRDVLTGIETHNRLEEVGGEETLGIHLNTLPFRVAIPEGSLLDLVRSVFEAEQEMLPFKRYPYAEIQKLHGKGPLFETIFNYTHFHVFGRLRALPHIKVQDGQGFGLRHYALSAEFNQNPFSGQIQLDLECNLESISRLQCEAIGRMYARVLQAIVTDPEAPADSTVLLSAEEIHLRAMEWNDTQAAVERRPFVHRWFEAQVERSPDAVAVACDGGILTYRELNRRANQLARYIGKSAIGAGRRVGVCLPRSPESAIVIWAILKSGAAYVPLDPAFPRERLGYLVDDAGLDLVVSQQSLEGAVPVSGEKCLWFDRMSPEISRESAENLIAEPDPDDLAYVMYTSGSTGASNGVNITHRNLACSTAARLLYYARSVTSFLLFPSFSFDSSVAGFFWTHCQGGALLIPEEPVRLDATQLGSFIRDWQASHWLSVPSFYRVLLEERVEDLGSLETVIMAGESCPGDLAAAHTRALPATAVFNEYGPTEATVWSSVHRYRNHDGETLPIGRPIANVLMFLLDAQFRPVPTGVAGEIHIAGDGLAQGYHQRSAITAEKFVPDPFSTRSGGRLFRTGDIARYAPDGVIEFLGRRDQQVKIRGHRIELGEIEAALREHPLVRDAVVLALNEGGRSRLSAYTVVRQSSLTGPDEIREFLLHKLPGFMIPASFTMLDELPLTAHGKVDRAQLFEAEAEHDAKASDFLSRLERLSEEEASAMLFEAHSSRRIVAGAPK